MKVFLSYSSSEKDLAQEIATHLSEAGFSVWSDEALAAGENWALKVGEALEASQAMVVLLSPQSLKSPFVRREIDFALVSPQFEGRLIPVVVRPTEDIPWILRKLPLVRVGKSTAEVSNRIVRQLQQADK